MTTEAALAKFSYLLAKPSLSTAEIVRRMSTSIRGELNEQSKTVFHHPGPGNQLPPKLASLSALGYAVNKGDLEAVLDVMRTEPEWLLNEADYSGNTPLVSPTDSCNLHPSMARSFPLSPDQCFSCVESWRRVQSMMPGTWARLQL